MSLLVVVLIFSTFLLSYLVLRVAKSIWWKPKTLAKQLKAQGIKGNHYKLLFGDMKELVNHYKVAWDKPSNLNHHIAARVDPFTHSMVEKYGKVNICWTGPTPSLIIMDPEMMKQVLYDKRGHFQKPHISPLINVLTKGITTLEGEKWAKHRKIINPAFHIEKLKGMVPVMVEACSVFINRWRNLIADENGSCELDIWPEFQNLTADVISRTGFGSNYEEGGKIFKLQKELVTLVIEAMQTVYIPGFRFIPTKKNRRRKELDKMITSMLTELIRGRENTIGSEEPKTDDLLGLLLHSNYQNNDSKDVKQGGMTIEEVIEECKQFYLAGQETTASLLTWTVIVLAMHPDWQEKARVEILQACGRDSISFEAIKNLNTVTMILNEVLRLYPPVIAHYRQTYKKTNIGEMCIPAGVNVTLPMLLMQHDPDIWGDDAEEFNPLRFSEGIAKASKDQLAFFPFGYGPRICVGQTFALIEAKVALSMLLQNFSIQLSPSYIHAPNTVMMLQPQHGAHIILQPHH